MDAPMLLATSPPPLKAPRMIPPKSFLRKSPKLRAFSSYYTGPSALPDLLRLEQLGGGGLCDEEISRRVQLLRRLSR